MGEVTIQPITKANWHRAVDLKVADGQEKFVAPNTYSLAEAAYEDYQYPVGIYNDEKMVGFAMYGYEDVDGYKLWYVSRLMVDLEHQGNGYGRAGMQRIIDKLKTEHGADGVCISYVKDNTAAAKLYESLGFVDEGLTIEGEILVVMRFSATIGESTAL